MCACTRQICTRKMGVKNVRAFVGHDPRDLAKKARIVAAVGLQVDYAAALAFKIDTQ
jgi:hypothetical protein